MMAVDPSSGPLSQRMLTTVTLSASFVRAIFNYSMSKICKYDRGSALILGRLDGVVGASVTRAIFNYSMSKICKYDRGSELILGRPGGVAGSLLTGGWQFWSTSAGAGQ